MEKSELKTVTAKDLEEQEIAFKYVKDFVTEIFEHNDKKTNKIGMTAGFDEDMFDAVFAKITKQGKELLFEPSYTSTMYKLLKLSNSLPEFFIAVCCYAQMENNFREHMQKDPMLQMLELMTGRG
jgi:hypothetical protein